MRTQRPTCQDAGNISRSLEPQCHIGLPRRNRHPQRSDGASEEVEYCSPSTWARQALRSPCVGTVVGQVHGLLRSRPGCFLVLCLCVRRPTWVLSLVRSSLGKGDALRGKITAAVQLGRRRTSLVRDKFGSALALASDARAASAGASCWGEFLKVFEHF